MKRVLIVEDDRHLLKYVSLLFRHHGYKVDSADSCGGGISLAQPDAYSLYLLDVNLPDGSGIDLCNHIRSLGGEAPIIMYSGDDSNETCALRAGADAFVPKDASLLDRLNQLLGCFEDDPRPAAQIA